MRRVSLLMLLIFSFSFISAYSDSSYDYKERITETKYYPQDNVVVSVTLSVNYDNKKRYSTYNYRNGYSYRTTEDYWDDRYDKVKKVNRYEYKSFGRRDYYEDNYGRGDYYYYEEPSYYYKYNSHLRSYEEIECYDSPPRGKLFYRRCP